MKRTLTTLVLAAGVVVGGISTAAASPAHQADPAGFVVSGISTAADSPAHQADAALQEEAAATTESCGPGYYPADQYGGKCVEVKRLISSEPTHRLIEVGRSVTAFVVQIGMLVW